METDAVSKAEDYYLIGVLLFEQNNMSKARQYCQKAIETNPDYGAPYILIRMMPFWRKLFTMQLSINLKRQDR